MRFVDLAIDLAAVFNASRSVASKHVALRSRQIDAYSRNSSVASSLKNKPAQGQRQSAENTAEAANAQLKTEASASERVEATPASKPPAPNPTRPSTFEAYRQQVGADRPAPSKEELDLPPDVDVDIFHTTRGSRVLDSVRKQKTSDIHRQRHTQPGGAAKEHPLRYWGMTPQPPLTERGIKLTPAVESEAKIAEIITEKYGNVTPSIPQSLSSNKFAVPLSHAAPAPPPEQHVKQEEIIELAEDLAGSNPDPKLAYSLRESKVPSSRFGRLWNYGGLATGMLGGAITESVSRVFGGGGSGSVLLSGANMERLVAKLSRMRGAALKLGQMMSFQDSKMLPKPIQEVLQRVQDRADYMPAWQRDRVLVSNLGADWRELYGEFEDKPIAAASIGQVHRATLKSNGRRVAVKIQFPGVADSINSDLDNLGILLNATKLLPKGLYLNKTIDNARTELGWECDYIREAECASRYKELLKGQTDVFQVPTVYPEASGKQVLTMDFMDGLTVTRIDSFSQEQRDWIGSQIMRLCLREITEFKFMQTDPNWTNFLYNAGADRLVLLDFGASREYPETFVRQYVQLLEAASRSDRQAVKDLSESLGYLTGHESKTMLDAHIASILTLAEPFLESAPEVYDFENQTITERVKALIPVMLHERLAPPPEETYSLHRKLSGAFLLCSRLGSKVRCREMFDKAVAKSGYSSHA